MTTRKSSRLCFVDLRHFARDFESMAEEVRNELFQATNKPLEIHWRNIPNPDVTSPDYNPLQSTGYFEAVEVDGPAPDNSMAEFREDFERWAMMKGGGKNTSDFR